jgi:hypothetical protein
MAISPGQVKLLCGVASFLLLTCTGLADDWPQWRGPNRDGIVHGVTLPAKWPEALKEEWKAPVGGGVLFAGGSRRRRLHLHPPERTRGRAVLRSGHRQAGVAFGTAASLLNAGNVWLALTNSGYLAVLKAEGTSSEPMALARLWDTATEHDPGRIAWRPGSGLTTWPSPTASP